MSDKNWESELQGLRRNPLPSEWRDELLGEASGAAKVSAYPVWRKFALVAAAACWVASAVLHLATPKPEASQIVVSEKSAEPMRGLLARWDEHRELLKNL